MQPETLTDLLNKVWAIWHIKLVTLQEIANHIGVDQRSVANWVTQRRRKPDGESFYKLKAFAATMTLKISKRPKLSERYRKAHEAAGVLYGDGKPDKFPRLALPSLQRNAPDKSTKRRKQP